MATEVELPQLGESVTEGTITAWLVEVGDKVEADQPLFELSSDKIDTEVPSPAAGVLKEIKVGVDETVDTGTVVAIIADEGEEVEGGADQDGEAAETDEAEAQADEGAETEPAAEEERDEPAAASTEEREDAAEVDGEEAADAGTEDRSEAAEPSGNGQGAGTPASPIVRRMAREHGLDLGSLSGSGEGGRVTREDVEAAIADQGEQPAAKTDEGGERAKEAPQKAPQPQRRADVSAGERERSEDMSRIRQRIAARMMESLQNSAQLTTVQEADVTRIMRLRAQHKDAFKQREGVSLSPFVFLARAAVLALRRHEKLNAVADYDAGKIKYHGYVNLGIAVDTPKGLLVPNVKGADDLTLAGLARGIAEAAAKARGQGKLEMQDIEGGTFTVTNTGSVGVLIDTPILNYPEVAILGTGAVQKRPMVVSDDDVGESIAIRDMCYLSLTYDHRLIDGADAARFVTDVAQVVETHDWAGELGY